MLCSDPWISIALTAAGAILLWQGWRGLRTGVVREDGDERIARTDRPQAYWLTVGIYLGLGAACLLFVVLTH